ncbi:MAG: hypothetical protein AB1345_00015 [Chloroflexota bacterium]
MKNTSVLLIVFLCLILNACQSQAPTPLLPTPTRISPDEGLGGIVGKVEDAYAHWPDERLYLYAAEFYGEPRGNGFFLLEPNLFPQTTLEADGFFQLNNAAPGMYVLVVGPDPRSAVPIKEQDRPMVIQVEQDKITDLGSVRLEP